MISVVPTAFFRFKKRDLDPANSDKSILLFSFHPENSSYKNLSTYLSMKCLLNYSPFEVAPRLRIHDKGDNLATRSLAN